MECLLRREMGRAVPKLPVLLRRLQLKNLLPAIFFIFSRAGCDDAAKCVCDVMLTQPAPKQAKPRQTQRRNISKEDYDFYDDSDDNESTSVTVRDKSGRRFRDWSGISDDKLTEILENETGSMDEAPSPRASTDQDPFSEGSFVMYANQGLLPLNSVKEVAARIKTFNQENGEISFNNEMAVQFLLGVGAHHAGMLAAHKAFVESLFQSQLMKVVFATETLAAGINMPARTTVICSMAKRGDGASLNLLETSNLLQMGGRAGRRRMDTDGTVVLVATTFEGPDVAASILLSEIKPISSQFSPSYTLAVNLIGRGAGKLGVARDLVQKSFAMWEKNQLESSLESPEAMLSDDSAEDIKVKLAQEHFISSLKKVVADAIDKSHSTLSPMVPVSSNLEECLAVLSSPKSLRKLSYSYEAASQLLTLERSTFEYLQQEADQLESYTSDLDQILGADLEEFAKEDVYHIADQIDTQKARILDSERDIANHPFTSLTYLANNALRQGEDESDLLRAWLAAARGTENIDELGTVTAEELVVFAKNAKQMDRKRRKRTSKGARDEGSTEEETVDTFEDMLSLIKVLESYGCLNSLQGLDSSDTEQKMYEITKAGEDIGLLNFNNALWALVALGGAWDVKYQSHRLDELQRSFELLYGESEEDEAGGQREKANEDSLDGSAMDKQLPLQEAKELVANLRDLSASEMAGYVSCLVSEGSRDGSNTYTYDYLEKLSRPQQSAIRNSILAAERLLEVQRVNGLDELSSACRLDLSVCNVVTGWTAGCTWNEALEMSGLAPGDLARVLHRAMDALRQFGSLPFNVVRSWDAASSKVSSSGVHPDIRRLCRDAATAMNRYPLKDPLPLDEEDAIDDSEVVDEFDLSDYEEDDDEDEYVREAQV